ncbi:MAG: DUF5911 domain-containing protein, partial [Candidatus Omnitrophica bacterium]|nr:DUF5911 domain-containing protein [Candidatus Omnitrophota bacterium]
MDKIQDYGVIGNCRCAALISKSGAIDWLCWPRFDSEPIFAYLLDSSRGQWKISPKESHQISRRYIVDTNILETTFTTSQGKIVLTDLMPVDSEENKKGFLLPENEILRKLECPIGKVEFDFKFFIRGLANDQHFFLRKSPFGIRIELLSGTLFLRTNVDLVTQKDSILTSLTINEGQVFYFSLTLSEEGPAVLPCMGSTTEERIESSILWWKSFVAQIQYEGPYRSDVIRSALILKLMNYAPSGAMVASVTTSLPEKLGGDLNWDYRYCWLRDAS